MWPTAPRTTSSLTTGDQVCLRRPLRRKSHRVRRSGWLSEQRHLKMTTNPRQSPHHQTFKWLKKSQQRRETRVLRSNNEHSSRCWSRASGSPWRWEASRKNFWMFWATGCSKATTAAMTSTLTGESKSRWPRACEGPKSNSSALWQESHWYRCRVLRTYATNGRRSREK